MTFLHFLNCVVLAFAPSLIVYNSTKLSEFRALSLCIWGGIAYTITQLVKMIFLATFLPTTETQTYQTFDLTSELLRTFVNFGDVLGASFVLNYVGGSYGGDLRLLGIGLGWATAEALLIRLAPLWMGARTLEFSWSFVQTSIEANVNLVLHISFITAVWLWSRKKLDRKLMPAIVFTLVVYSVLPLATNYLRYILDFSSWTILLIHIGVTLFLGVLARGLYSSFQSSLASGH